MVDLQKKRLRAAKLLAVGGIASTVYGLSKQVPDKADLHRVAARVISVSTVHLVQENSSQSVSSINPFATDWWIELTVVPSSPAEAGTDPRVWKVSVMKPDDELRGWIGSEIVGSVTTPAARSEAFQIRSAQGRDLVDYDTATQSRRKSEFLFLILGGIALAASLVIFLLFRPRPTGGPTGYFIWH
ncbi:MULTISPECIES: hypothetical protein [unclassified Rhizobium]|uniref:hypothetical protein n=1 Tax=unclassified Rhizobium TaxID=2613769 RepID=UPI0037FFF797